MRFWTAAWVAVFCVFKIIKEHKYRYILLALATPFFHGAYWVFVVLLLIVLLFRRFEKLWIVAFFCSFLLSNLFLAYAQEFSAYLPSALAGVVRSYTNIRYVVEVNEADTGFIRTAEGEFKVEDTIKLLGGKIGHVGVMTKGMIKAGDKVFLEVDAKKRALSARNHSATHLLQKALRTVLGTHVEQAGSSVNEDRLRFDFTHFSAMTAEELKKVEDIVNEQISNGLQVIVKNMPIEEAKKTGAQALFGEKYGDIVRVVNMSDFSIEFCGGTHVKNTSEIMAFKIISETGVAAGVRRIEALTSDGLMKYYADIEEKLKNAAHLLKATPDNLSDKISHMLAENKSLHSEIESLKSKMAQEAAGDVMDQVKEVKGVKLLAAQIDGVDMNGLRDLGDQLKEKLGEGVVVLASGNDGKVSLMATATDGAMKKGAHAGNLVKGIAGCVGGGGGGRPNMAQAGGKNPAGIPDALEKAAEVLEGQIN